MAYILLDIKRKNPASTQIVTIVQENIQHQDESTTADRHCNEGSYATATPTPSPATQRPPRLMTGAECMLPREAYDALERKRTVHCNQGQPENKVTDDEGVDIRVRVTATGTQDTTVHQENTQLDQTNGTSSETSAIPNSTATPTQSPVRQHPPHMRTGAERMLPREAYDALECKRTDHFYQGQPEDEETDDEGVDIRVGVTGTGTQDTTVHQETLNSTKPMVPPVKLQQFPTKDILPSFHYIGEVSLMSLTTTTLRVVSVMRTLSVTKTGDM